MPVFRQPPSLLSRSLSVVRAQARGLGFTALNCPSSYSIDWLMSEWRDSTRPQWGGGAIPTALRSQLLHECIGTLEDLMPIYRGTCPSKHFMLPPVLAALLDRDIRELRLRLCCMGQCLHRELTLDVIGRCIGPGLVTLELTQAVHSSDMTDVRLLRSVFMSAENLTTLVLKGIATDRILREISKYCFKLTVLDVSDSLGVSDVGICNLMYFPHHLPSKWPKYSPMCLISETLLVNSNESDLIRIIEKIHWPTSAAAAASGHREPTPYKPTRLCGTLRVLDVTHTIVTRLGKVIALLSAGHLWSLGEQCHVGWALDMLSRCAVPRGGDGLRLAAVTTRRATGPALRALAATCPRLRGLTVPNPQFLPDELDAAMPDALARLDLRRVPARSAWLDGLLAYLRGPRSRGLRELSLEFRDVDGGGEALDTVDLGALLAGVPELDTLVLDGVGVTFGAPRPAWRRYGGGADKSGLRRVQLSRVQDPVALARLVRRAPGLEMLRVTACPGLDGGSLLAALSGAARLRCVRFSRVDRVDVATVQRLAAECPALVHVADVYSWSLSMLDISNLRRWVIENNYDLLLADCGYWRTCRCFGPDRA